MSCSWSQTHDDLSLQAQHHMKQQVYVGSVAVNHSIEGPISDPVALPAGEQLFSIAYLAQENCVHGCLAAEPISRKLPGM